MKAVVQAMWLLTTAIGSLIVIVVVESFHFSTPAVAFFSYAGVLGIVVLLFIYVSLKYEYVADLPDDERIPIVSAKKVGKHEVKYYYYIFCFIFIHVPVF